MSDIDDKRRIVLLEATLREILRINSDAEADKAGSMGFDTALDGQLLRQWKSIKRKAQHLLANP
jgi:hypothetical protein